MFGNLNGMVSNMTLDQAQGKALMAQKTGDRKSEAIHRLLAAKILVEEGQPGEAKNQAQMALAIFQGLKNRIGEASSLLITAQGDYLLGNFPAAQRGYEGALELYSKSGDLTGEAVAHLGLAAVFFDDPMKRDVVKVKNHLNQAIRIYQRLGDYQSQRAAAEMLRACDEG